MPTHVHVWISLEPLHWPGQWSSGTSGVEPEWRRPYEMLAHADRCLTGQPDEFARIDALTTVKRTIDHRVRILEEKHGLRDLPVRDKPSDILKIMEWVGLIRPTMLQKLIETRNAVEHQDQSPPNTYDSRVFADFAWFFLRATDVFVQRVVETFVFKRDHSVASQPHWIQFNVDPPGSWGARADGWLPPALISKQHVDGWLQVALERWETRAEVSARLASTHSQELKASALDYSSDDVRFIGAVRGPGSALHTLFRRYFALG